MCKNRGPVIPAPQLEVVYEAQDITAQKYISTSQPLRNQTPRRHHRPHRRNGFTLLTAECQPPPWRRHNIKWQLRKTAHFLKVKSVTKSASLTLATKGHKRPRKSIRESSWTVTQRWLWETAEHRRHEKASGNWWCSSQSVKITLLQKSSTIWRMLYYAFTRFCPRKRQKTNKKNQPLINFILNLRISIQ